MRKTSPAVYSKLIFKGLGKDLCSTNAMNIVKKKKKKNRGLHSSAETKSYQSKE